MSQWNEKKSDFEPDGSLRDIYVKNIDAKAWSLLLERVSVSSLEHEFWHGEKECALPRDFAEIRKLQDSDPTTLKIYLEQNIQINCHFFLEEEVEMDVSPKVINNELSFNILQSFMAWLAEVFNRPVYLTQENTPGEVILNVVPENV